MLDLGRPAGELIGEIRSATEFKPTATRYEYLVTQFCVIVTYIRMLFWPKGQNIDHDFPIQASLLAPRPLLSLLFLFGLFVLAVCLSVFRPGYLKINYRSSLTHLPSLQRADPATRLIGFGILWFFIALSVESSIIPITDVIFEHRVYLPSVGAFTAIAAAFVMLLARVGRPGLARGLKILAACVLLALVVATWKRNDVWRSPITLWQDAAAKSPHKARPFNNLGALLGEAGRMEEAIPALYQAARLRPNDAEPFVNLGAALASAGRMEEAAGVLSKVVRLQPDSPDALNNLGIVLKDTGRLDEAIAALSESVRIKPDHAKAHYNLGRAFLLTDRRAEGVSALRRAIELKPDYDNAYAELAAALNEDGRHREASTLLEPNIARLSSRPDVRYNLGVAAHCTGDRATATRELVALERLDAKVAGQLAAFLSRPCSGFHGREAR
jgi:Flp pilus assembly protein TadD